MSDVLELRRCLWAMGYKPVGVKTGLKVPEGLDWQKRALIEPRSVSRHALSTGVLCAGLRCIDIDVADTGLSDQINALVIERLGYAPVRYRAGSGKRLLVYAARVGEPKKRFISKDACKIEVLGAGQQFVGYGMHPDGMDYEWRNGDLSDIAIENLTKVTEDQITSVLNECALLIGALNEVERDAAKVARPVALTSVVVLPQNETQPTGRYKRYAENTLDHICNDLSSEHKGSRNQGLNNAAMRLAGMAAHGWIDANQCVAHLMACCEANGLMKEDGYAACKATLESGWNAGLSKPAPIPANQEIDDQYPGIVINLTLPTHTITADGDVISDATGEVLYSATSAPPEPVGFDVDLTYVPGLVGEIIEWIVSSARQPSRPLALAAALVSVGTLIARRLVSPTGCGTHLYIVSLAPTGSGKQHPQDCVQRLMQSCGNARCHGPPSFMSMSAMINHIAECPISVCCQDEYGAFLKRVNSKNADPHSRGISDVMRNIWGLSFQSYKTPRWAASASVEVAAVAFSMLGSSTKDEFISSLSGTDVSNGFLNRFLVIDGGARAPVCDPALNKRIVPPEIVDRLKLLAYGDKEQVIAYTGDFEIEPQVVPFAEPSAKRVYDELLARCIVAIDDETEQGEYYARTAEIALRLATIVAAGIDLLNPKISQSTMEWAARVAWQSSSWTAHQCETQMTEELNAAKLEIKIRQRLTKKAESYRILHRCLFRYVRNPDDLKRVLAAMEASGTIYCFEEKAKNGTTIKSFSLAN